MSTRCSPCGFASASRSAASSAALSNAGRLDRLEDALAPAEVTSAVESTLARAYDVDSEELAELLFPED